MFTLKQARLLKELTQKEMSKKLGISEYVYRKYECNTDKIPIGVAQKITSILGMSYDSIFFSHNSSLTR